MVRKFANGNPKPHQDWDFSASIGTAVYAIADGKVEFIILIKIVPYSPEKLLEKLGHFSDHG